MPYTIVIDAGHGGSDPGAVYEGRREKDDNLSLAIAVGELLSRQGVSVIYTRTTDVYQTPFEKAQMANQADADFFISFHRNSSEEPNQYTGVETLVYDNSGIKQTMAENINGALSELGFRNLGVKARPGLVVLRRTKMPALLIETGFLNNEQDNTLYDEKQEKIARAIEKNHPDIELMILLIDERPEEVTDIRRSVRANVFYSTFDSPQENHVRVADMVYERAQRLVEQGKNVVVLMDSLTRLARACNALSPGGRAMSGGLAPGALDRPKRFFGAARNIEEGGSLTMIATVLVETGSRMDDIIFEEFKGTGNAEIKLDRALSEARIFPAIDLAKSGTRHEELLLSPAECEGVAMVRRMLGQGHTREATAQLISMLLKTEKNEDFFKRLKEWLAIWEKEGYTIRSLRSGV